MTLHAWPTGVVEIDLEQPTLDACEVCLIDLYPSERVEVIVGAPESNEFGGMTAVIATFCKEHKP